MSQEREEPREAENPNAAGNAAPHWRVGQLQWGRGIEISALVVLAIVGALQYGVLNRQAAIMKSQNVIATQQTYIAKAQTSLIAVQTRPWIKADLVIDGDFKFQAGIGYYTPVHVNLTNIGHSPAFDVRTGVYPYVPQKKGEDMLTVWRERCENNRKVSDTIPDFGTVLFPGEQGRSDRDTPATIGIVSVEQVDRGLKASESGDRLDLRIMGCISYTDPSGTPYQTGINYKLWTINPNGAWNIGINPTETIKGSDIYPIMFHISGGMTY